MLLWHSSLVGWAPFNLLVLVQQTLLGLLESQLFPCGSYQPGCLRPMGLLLVSVPLVSTAAHRLQLLCRHPQTGFELSCQQSRSQCADQSNAKNVGNQQKYLLNSFLGYCTRTLAPWISFIQITILLTEFVKLILCLLEMLMRILVDDKLGG